MYIEQGMPIQIHLITEPRKGGHGQLVLATVGSPCEETVLPDGPDSVTGLLVFPVDHPELPLFVPLKDGQDGRRHLYVVVKDKQGRLHYRPFGGSIDEIEVIVRGKDENDRW